MAMSRQAVEDLLNLYLFDVEVNASPLDEEISQKMEEQKQTIVRALEDLEIADLQLLKKRYQTQHQERVDEVEWREATGKSRNIPCELVEIGLSGLLKRMEEVIRRKQNPPAPKPTVAAKPNTASLSKQNREEQDKQRRTTASMKAMTPAGPPNTALSSPAPREKTQRVPEMKPKPIKPSRPDEQDAENMAWEEFSSASAATPTLSQDDQSPEERLHNLVEGYLQKHPQVNWQERDRHDERMRQALFQKEAVKKKEIETFQQQQQQRSQTKSVPQQKRETSLDKTVRRPAPQITNSDKTVKRPVVPFPPANLPQGEDAKKRWWPFGRND